MHHESCTSRTIHSHSMHHLHSTFTTPPHSPPAFDTDTYTSHAQKQHTNVRSHDRNRDRESILRLSLDTRRHTTHESTSDLTSETARIPRPPFLFCPPTCAAAAGNASISAASLSKQRVCSDCSSRPASAAAGWDQPRARRSRR